jgi:hypothetical protein
MSRSSSSQNQSSVTPSVNTTDYNSDSELSDAPTNLTLMNRSFDAAILKSRSKPKSKKRKVVSNRIDIDEESDTEPGEKVLIDHWSRTVAGRTGAIRQVSACEELPNEVCEKTVAPASANESRS